MTADIFQVHNFLLIITGIRSSFLFLAGTRFHAIFLREEWPLNYCIHSGSDVNTLGIYL